MWNKLLTILKNQNLTIADLVRMTGISRRTIENIKNHNPSFCLMETIADSLDISLDEFRKIK